MRAASLIRAKYFLFISFGLAALFVLLTRDRTLLDPHSFLRQRYAASPWLMFAHGIPGALALGLGVLQFSDPLRRTYLQVHRVLGRLYVRTVAIPAPVAIPTSFARPTPPLAMPSSIR